MDENLSKLKQQISKIDTLKSIENWGPEYQIWEGVTMKLVRQAFGHRYAAFEKNLQAGP